jgi:hypothetical protein
MAGKGEGEVLVDGLGRRVRPPIDGGRAQHPVVVLRHRHLGRLAVHLRGGGEKDLAPVPVAGGEHVLGPPGVGEQGSERVVDDVADPDGRRQVEDHLHLAHLAIDEVAVEDGAVHEVHVAESMADVLGLPGGQIVDDPDVMTGVAEHVNEVGADIAGTAGHQDTHGRKG